MLAGLSRGETAVPLIGKVLREVEASLLHIDPSHIDEVDELSARRASRKAV